MTLAEWIPVGVALIASVTALVVAFIAYPKQRDKDRELQLHEETRRVYVNCLTSFNSWFACLARNKLGEAKECYYEFVQQIMILQLYASEEVLKATRQMIDETKVYRNIRGGQTEASKDERAAQFVKVKGMREDFLVACRAHLFSASSDKSRSVIRSIAPVSQEETNL